MHFGKTQVAISGGAIALRGKKYHLDRVLYAYGELIDLLTIKFGNHRSTAVASTAWQKLRSPLQWPHPAKDETLRNWRHWARSYDGLGDHVRHDIGPLQAYGYVLSQGWIVYNPRDRTVKKNDGSDVDGLDCAPCVDIYARANGDEVVGISERLSAKVQELVVGDMAKFGMIYTTVSYERAGGVEIIGRVGFPHSVYGAGEDWLRVRCLSPDGEELESADGPN